MNKRFLGVAMLIAAAFCVPFGPLASGQQGATATLTIKVPPDAKLYFDGSLTSQTGPTRMFVTPPLAPGATFNYTIKAEVVRGGQVLSQTKQVPFQAGQSVPVDFSEMDKQESSASGQDQPAGGDGGWPRKIEADGKTITIYQPQVEGWERDKLTARAAVSVTNQAAPQQTFGVVWFTARTDVDREDSIVVLNDFKITKVSFPSAPDKADSFKTLLTAQLPSGSKSVSLARLKANLAVTEAESKVANLPLKNEPPRIIYATKPADLVLVDGTPVMRDVPGANFRRVINTRALLLQDLSNGVYYLHFVDSWLQSKSFEDTVPWSVAANPPASLEAVKKSFANDQNVDLLDDPAPDLKEEMEKGIQPDVYVSTVPAELLELKGEPDFTPIDGTQLLYLKNTPNQVLLDTASSDYYVLFSGRWFRSKSLANGPWEFVPADKLPADVSKIPENHPAGDVLAAVSGTPQSKEALIANEIPQTSTIKRSEANLTPVYDGDPDFQPIEQTSLSYAVNSPTPVIQVAPNSYYAVENGVWFVGPNPAGPWLVADSVPPVIYTIPPSSPLYYVTYVQVFGATPDVVYCGYTPGYFGTCVAPWGTVVYGTGWRYRPWIGRSWYGRPWTYGCDASFRWNTAGGWSFGFGTALGRPWWGPVGWNASRGGIWRAGWQTGWGGRYAGIHTSNIHVNNFNLYNRWPTNAVVARRTTTVAAATRTNVVAGRGLNNVYAGAGGEVYKRTTTGWGQNVGAAAWRPVQPNVPAVTHLNQQFGARSVGAFNAQAFRTTGGFAGAGGVRVGGVAGYRGVAAGGFRRR